MDIQPNQNKSMEMILANTPVTEQAIKDAGLVLDRYFGIGKEKPVFLDSNSTQYLFDKKEEPGKGELYTLVTSVP
jgi:hypothetical protein